MMCMEKFTFGLIHSDGAMVEKNMVDEICQDIYVYNQTFTHEDDEFSFNYTYAIEVLDKEEHDIDETIVSLYLTVDGNSLSDKFYDNKSDVTPYDLIMDGCGVVEIAYDEPSRDIDIDEYIRKVFAFVPAINSMRGFYLDKTWNQIGTNGWDSIKYAIGVTDKLFN